eukprot:GHUV01050395.1.p1 GENE.GHUV01050395.1~~GHUV01050395.1.p1  ORF type:complete len:111 (+),score=8.13 GHUV01050395.1:138-470(+)
MSTSRYLPVESAMPGTTLGLIALKAFDSGGTLYGTLGPWERSHCLCMFLECSSLLVELQSWFMTAPHVCQLGYMTGACSMCHCMVLAPADGYHVLLSVTRRAERGASMLL